MCNCKDKKLKFETLVVTWLTDESCLPRVGAHHYKCCDHAGVIIFGISPSFKVSGFIVWGLRGRHSWPSQKWVLLCNYGDGELAVPWRVMYIWKNKRWKFEIVLATWLTDESCVRSGADQLWSGQCSRSHWSWSCGNGWWNFCGIFFLCLGVLTRILHLKSPCRILVWGNHLVKSMARYSWETCWWYTIFFTVLLLRSRNCVLYPGWKHGSGSWKWRWQRQELLRYLILQLSSLLHQAYRHLTVGFLTFTSSNAQHKIMINSRKGSTSVILLVYKQFFFCLQVIKTLVHEYPSALIGVSTSQLTKSDWWIHIWKTYTDEENHSDQSF